MRDVTQLGPKMAGKAESYVKLPIVVFVSCC